MRPTFVRIGLIWIFFCTLGWNTGQLWAQAVAFRNDFEKVVQYSKPKFKCLFSGRVDQRRCVRKFIKFLVLILKEFYSILNEGWSDPEAVGIDIDFDGFDNDPAKSTVWKILALNFLELRLFMIVFIFTAKNYKKNQTVYIY